MPGPTRPRDTEKDGLAVGDGSAAGLSDAGLADEPAVPSAGSALTAAEPAAAAASASNHDDSSDDDIGPKLPAGLGDGGTYASDGASGGAGDMHYGRGLRPGEGAAMAAFVAAGQRIPHRGEVGWASSDIDRLQEAGYIMSGSRHQKMTQMRLRKEGQVYSAEERRALALVNYEEKLAREERLMAEFKAMIGGGDASASGTAAAASGGAP